MQQLLIVRWKNATEFIAFDEGDNFHHQMITTERWPNSIEVNYIANATFERIDRSRKLTLIYNREKQTDKIIRSSKPGDISYGTSAIEWTTGDATGRAHWKDNEEDSDCDGFVSVSVLGGQAFQAPERAKKSVLVASRPHQAEFRDALIQLDKQCVLTGVECREALEAAHLVPVAQKGLEQIENGILLRADLHLLFDAGLIWFDVLDDHAVVDCSSDDEYVTILKGKRLPDKTFQRVKASLLKRAALPGGRGRDRTE